MNFDFSDDQKMLRNEAQRFLRERCGFAQVRSHLQSAASYDRELWGQIVEMGWTGTGIEERHGGLGLGPLELCVLNEELGRSLAPVPFFSTVCLAAELLRECSAEAAAETLAAIAARGLRVAVATAEGGRDWHWHGIRTAWSGKRLTGCKAPVPDLPDCERIIVSAVDGTEPVLVLVDPGQEGVRCAAVAGFDGLRSHGELQLRDARGVELLRGEGARCALDRVLEQAAIFAAFEQIGGAEAAMGMARDYALQRFAFGRPIGGNQAVKHRLADMLVKIELARSNAYFGAWAMERRNGELTRAAAAARLSATEAFEFAAEENLHLHGGIGYTWEADCHFYYRRARLLAVSLGNSAAWAERLLATPLQAAA